LECIKVLKIYNRLFEEQIKYLQKKSEFYGIATSGTNVSQGVPVET